jgi:tRNA threonylcarbamoyladenosine biosynthesis protein TsaE
MTIDPIVPPLAAHGRLAFTQSELIDWGERFGRVARAPLIVTISGDLGAGKTTLIQAICRGYGVGDEVTSPTFALVHRYASSRSPVLHLDLYRLAGPADLANLGWDELMAEDALILVEWPERAGDRIPGNHVPMSLHHLPDEPDRRLFYAGRGID